MDDILTQYQGITGVKIPKENVIARRPRSYRGRRSDLNARRITSVYVQIASSRHKMSGLAMTALVLRFKMIMV